MSRKFLAVVLFVAVLGGLSSVCLAQAAGDAGPTKVTKTWFEQYWLDGGPIVWLILTPLSIVTVALAIEHVISIRRTTLLPEASTAAIQQLFEQGQYREAIEYTAADPSFLSFVLHAALNEAASGYASMERAMEEASEERTTKLLRKIEWINIIGNVAPMIGLFGTVVGMIGAFASIEREGIPRADLLAGNIAVALLTTMWGLFIAIIALSVYGVFRNRIDAITAEGTLQAQDMIARFRPGARAARGSAAPRPAPTPSPAAKSG